MGRAKSLTNKGRFYLRKDRKPNEKGEYPIYVQYTIDRKIAKADIGVSIGENQWDESKQRVRSSHPLATRINNMLDRKRNEIEAQMIEYKGRLTIDVVREMVQGEYNPNKEADADFVQLAIDTINTQYKIGKVGISVRDNALCNLKQFRRFLKETTGKGTICIGKMTIDVIHDFIIWKKESRGNKEETINKALTPLMKAANEAARHGWMSAEEAASISNSYLMPKADLEEEAEDRDVKYLTKKQLAEFVDYYAKAKYPKTRDYMDMFLFAFHACGLRFSDVLTLRWSDIDFETKHLNKVLVKGRKKQGHRIALTPSAIAILEKWKAKGLNNRFVFGLLPNNFDLNDEEELKRQRLNRNRPIIQSLRTIGDKMGLNFSLTFHVARHTFAVCALNDGVGVHKISQMLGHGSVTVTEKVYAKWLPKTLDDEVLNLNYSFLPKAI